MRYIHKRTGIILGIILIISLVITTTVYAEITEYNINSGNVNILTPGEYRIKGDGTSTNNKIKVTAMSGDITIYLKDVHIDVSGFAYNVAFLIEKDSKANITIILEGENILESGSEKAGLQKDTKLGNNSGKLIIDGEGKLTAYGSHIGAGIGGATGKNSANIEIRGGTIKTDAKCEILCLCLLIL